MKTNTYVSPMADICYLESEGVLCASGEVDTSHFFDGLPDYNPSEGEW